MVGVSAVDAQLILCDAAQADSAGGKVHMLGAGWSVTSSPTAPHSVVVLAKIPWDRANQKIHFRLALRTADGEAVTLTTPDGRDVGVEHEGDIEVGRPPGIPHGSMLDTSFVLNLPPLPLPPGRYEWRLEIAEETRYAAFTARPAG